jgi:peptide-methionine (S)-S-oxide reductase
MFAQKKADMPRPDEALPGREEVMSVPERHFVNGNPLLPPFPEGLQMAMFGMGCFWGAERRYWELPGVFSTMVGYAAGWVMPPVTPLTRPTKRSAPG